MIIRVNMDVIPTLTLLASQVWPKTSKEELQQEISETIEDSSKGLYFVYLEGKDAIGFAQCSLRTDYVEGSTTSPVAYLESMYVNPAYRGQGKGRELVVECEKWAKEMGCAEFASDCYMDGDFESKKAFHEALGFKEVNRIVCYIKPLA